jgi:hypothetical protein
LLPGAAIGVVLGVVGEVRIGKQAGATTGLRERHIGTDVLVFDGDDVLSGAVLAVASDLAGP